MEFGLKGTSRLVAGVTGSRHSGLGFTVFWLFTAEMQLIGGLMAQAGELGPKVGSRLYAVLQSAFMK